MVVGEIAIHLTEQFNDLATQSTENTRRAGTRNAIARIDDNFERPREMNTGHNALYVSWQYIDRSNRTTRIELP